MDKKNETYAIVGCGENPNFQVWGARSDLKCPKKKSGALNMKFGDWVEKRKKRDGNGR